LDCGLSEALPRRPREYPARQHDVVEIRITDEGRAAGGVFGMVETRIAPRVRVSKAAKLEYGGDKISCIIRDISTTGAALEILDVAKIPDALTLVVPDDGLKLPCHVVWRRGFRIGIAFD
jgi:hypothetical protein